MASGVQANVGRRHREAVDLAGIYRELWGDPAGARMVDLALFCDSDDTGGETIAYFTDVRVTQEKLTARSRAWRSSLTTRAALTDLAKLLFYETPVAIMS